MNVLKALTRKMELSADVDLEEARTRADPRPSPACLLKPRFLPQPLPFRPFGSVSFRLGCAAHKPPL